MENIFTTIKISKLLHSVNLFWALISRQIILEMLDFYINWIWKNNIQTTDTDPYLSSFPY